MYQELLEMERKLDWTVMRKKVEIEDALARVQPVRRPWLSPSFDLLTMLVCVGTTDTSDIP